MDSHWGQLIHASPEQIRSASMRERHTIASQHPTAGSLRESGSNGSYPGIRNVVDLLGNGGFPLQEEVDREGDVSMGPVTGPAGPALGEVHVPGPPPDPDVLEYSPDALGNSGEDGAQPELAAPDVLMEGAGRLEVHETPVPEEGDDDLLFGDTECFLAFPDKGQVWEMTLHETQVDAANLPSAQQALEYVMLATPERKKRVEVKMRHLSSDEQEQFVKAKGKEVGAWLSHQTVRRVAAGTLADEQLLRCRWILTWKAPEQTGGPRRAKARLVVLGFEDPGLGEIPNDAPTLGKDARQLILRKVAANKWKLVNFDISTAFLQGQDDGRIRGIHPPTILK